MHDLLALERALLLARQKAKDFTFNAETHEQADHWSDEFQEFHDLKERIEIALDEYFEAQKAA